MEQETQNWLLLAQGYPDAEVNLSAENPRVIPKSSAKVAAMLHTLQKEEEMATYSCAGIVEL